MMMILFFAITLIVYAIMYAVTKSNIIAKIKVCRDDSIRKYGIYDERLYGYLSKNKEKLAIYGALGWPIYYLFSIGAACGSDIFNTLTSDNYENRIATWLI
jgi:hypothetical protein